MGENIGAAARVMANFGLADLRLVAPRDGWPNEKAEAMAAGALEGPVSAAVFADLDAAIADLTYVVAATARPRHLEKPVLVPGEAAGELRARGAGTAVLFGAEKSGLPNEAVARADAIVTYPVDSAFPSLNLAQAVGVFAYAWATGAGPAEPLARPEPASKKETRDLVDHLLAELEEARFFFPPEKVEMMELNVRAAFDRAGLTSQEVSTLRGAIKALANGPKRRRSE
jgi:tRNA/rRNA methyltransferase